MTFATDGVADGLVAERGGSGTVVVSAHVDVDVDHVRMSMVTAIFSFASDRITECRDVATGFGHVDILDRPRRHGYEAVIVQVSRRIVDDTRGISTSVTAHRVTIHVDHAGLTVLGTVLDSETTWIVE